MAQQKGINFTDEDTVRERIDILAETEPCGSCHRQFDPYGMVLQGFDHFGRYSEVVEGAPVDNVAIINEQEVKGAKELADILLADENTLASCLFGHLFSYGTGYYVNSSQVDILGAHGFGDANLGDFNDWVRAVVTHPNFSKISN